MKTLQFIKKEQIIDYANKYVLYIDVEYEDYDYNAQNETQQISFDLSNSKDLDALQTWIKILVEYDFESEKCSDHWYNLDDEEKWEYIISKQKPKTFKSGIYDNDRELNLHDYIFECLPNDYSILNDYYMRYFDEDGKKYNVDIKNKEMFKL